MPIPKYYCSTCPHCKKKIHPVDEVHGERALVIAGINRIAEIEKHLETEKTMHAAWRKRAEEVEEKLLALAT